MNAHSVATGSAHYHRRMKNEIRAARFVLVACTMALAACGGGAASAVPTTASPTPARGGSGSTTSSSASYTCPKAQTSSGALICASLPLGDKKYSLTSPQAGYIYACEAGNGTSPVATAPWLGATTWNLLAKVVVQGSVSWPGSVSITTSGATRTIATNGVPIAPYTTGIFPIAASDPAHQYDGNPNSIAQRNTTYDVPANPTIAASPSCLGMGPIGVTVTGVAVYDACAAADGDAVAREEQDSCHGHPDRSDTYHYHGILQACVPDAGSATQNSSLLAYALDGFAIYGPWYNGKILTTKDLDECHGTTSPVMWGGQLVNMYHYVSTYDFPYTVGCYRGTPM